MEKPKRCEVPCKVQSQQTCTSTHSLKVLNADSSLVAHPALDDGK